MKTLRFLLATSVSLLALSAVRADGGFGHQWMDNYFQAPRPDDLLKAVYSLDHEGYFDQTAQADTAIGFFSVVFRQNPREVNQWLRRSASFLSPRSGSVLAFAAWLAGNPAGEERIRELNAASVGGSHADVDRLLAARPASVAATPVLSEASMNLQWGAFLASGEERYIVNVFAAFGSNEPGLATSARFSLAENAAAHPRVLEICREQLDRQPEPIRGEIQAAMDEAASGKPRA